MQRSLSVSRQGTFDTGPAQIDSWGSIRRGEVELPVVDENSVRQRPQNGQSDDSSPRDRELDRYKHPNSDNIINGVASSDAPPVAKQTTSDITDTSRYVDHNLLFPGVDTYPQVLKKPFRGNREPAGNLISSQKSLNARRKDRKGASSSVQKSDQSDSGEQALPGNNSLVAHEKFVKDIEFTSTPRALQQSPKSLENKAQVSPKNVDNKAQLSPKARESDIQLSFKALEKGPEKGPENQVSQKKVAVLDAPQPESALEVHTSDGSQRLLDHRTSSTQQSEYKRKGQEPNTTVSKPPISHTYPLTASKNKSQLKPHLHSKDNIAAKGEESATVALNKRTVNVHSSPGKDTETDQKPVENISGQNISVATPEGGDHIRTQKKDSTGKDFRSTEERKDLLRSSEATQQKESDQEPKLLKTVPTAAETSKPQKAASYEEVELHSNATMDGAHQGFESLAHVRSERDQLVQAEKTYRQRISQLEEEVKSVVQQSEELSEENKVLRSKVDAFDDAGYAGSLELRELRREKQELVAMVARLTTEKESLETENEKLKSKIADHDIKIKQWDTIFLENSKLKSRQLDLERSVQNLEKEKQGLENNAKSVDSQHLDKLSAAHAESKRLAAEVDNLQEKLSSLESQVAALKAENKNVSDKLEKKRVELNEAMRVLKSESKAEAELKDANSRLERLQNKVSEYEVKLDEAVRKGRDAEEERDSAKSSIAAKEAEFKTLKTSLQEKDTQVSDLRRQLDVAKQNIEQLEEKLEDLKQSEKDTVNMKARILSLKNEIDDSLATNAKMKQERTELKTEVNRLAHELAESSESLAEAHRFIKKLEAERSALQESFEEERKSRKKHEQDIEREVVELHVQNDQLKEKVKELEQDKEDMLSAKNSASEVEVINRKLKEENHKLRHMLVERNMEIAQRQSERTALVKRVDMLERKQDDSDIKMEQLKGWVDAVHTLRVQPDALHPSLPEKNKRRTDQQLSLPSVLTNAGKVQASKSEAAKKTRRKKSQQQNQLNRSWDDLTHTNQMDHSVHTTPSLPVVLDNSTVASTSGYSPPGYIDLYRQKMKLVRTKKL